MRSACSLIAAGLFSGPKAPSKLSHPHETFPERFGEILWQTDIAAQAGLLHETAGHYGRLWPGLLDETAGQHGAFEALAPPHDWWDWYAAYMDARQRGSNQEDASAAAARYMAEVKHVVV